MEKYIEDSNWTVNVEGIDNDIISKAKFKKILELQKKLLQKEKVNDFKSYISEISFEFEFVSFHNANVFYWFLLDIYDFLLNFDNFKKDFYIDYPIAENKKYKKENHNKFMKNYIKNRFFDNKNYNNYFFLWTTIIDSVKDIKKNITLYKKVNSKNQTKSNFYLENLKELNKALELIYLKKKEKEILEKCFIKDETYSNTYILINENSQNLKNLMTYFIKDKFSLDDKIYKKLKKSKYEVEVNFLTY